MKLKSFLTALALCCFIAGHAQTAQAPTADEIVTKYINAIGGKDKWKALKSMTISAKMSMMGMDLPMTLYSKPANKQKAVISIQGVEIVQAYDGKDAWAINPMGGGKEPQLIPAADAKELTDEEFENEFIDYKTKGHAVTYQGIEEIDGVKCYKIEMIKNKNNDKEDVTEIYFFDAENYVPISVKSYARSGQMKGQEIQSYLSDYQDVNGLMVAFFNESKVGGQTVQKLTMEKVTFNDPMDDSIFAFPKK